MQYYLGIFRRYSMVFQKELKRLGLKDKEAAVYLSCLELGPAPVQQIARKAKVVRATTYVVLEALAQRGLVTQYKEGKKTLFSAEPPSQLMRLLEKQEETIEEKKHELTNMLPELQALIKISGERPSVRYFDGIEGLRAIRREMMMYSDASDTWYNFTPVDQLEAVLKREEEPWRRQRVAKKIKIKTIFTTRSPQTRRQMSETSDPLSERRYISYELFPSTSGMTVFKDRIAIGSFTGKIGGVIIESSSMANMVRRLFELAWLGAESVDTTK